MTGQGPYRRRLHLIGAQVLFAATCVGLPVSAAPPTGRAVRRPPEPVAAPSVPATPATAAAAPAPAPEPPPTMPVVSAPPPAVAPAPAPPPPDPVRVAAAAPPPPAPRRVVPVVTTSSAPPANPGPAAAVAATSPEGPTVVRIGGWAATIERGGQAVIDRCKATLFWGPWPAERPGTVWLAGHNNCGFGFWADLPMGTTVSVTGPHGAVSYVIVSRSWVPRKSGSSRGLIHDDLILQTCLGHGTSLTYARRS